VYICEIVDETDSKNVLAAILEEEEDDDKDPFEFLLKIPCFGKPIYDQLEKLTGDA
jgi:hypothetical protein